MNIIFINIFGIGACSLAGDSSECQVHSRIDCIYHRFRYKHPTSFRSVAAVPNWHDSRLRVPCPQETAILQDTEQVRNLPY